MHLRTTPVPGWPPLAWIACVARGDDEIAIYAGDSVEVGDRWACEGIWDGRFPDGDVDKTDLVFGSGVRVRDDRVVFVSSGTTVDRLHTWHGDGLHYVSNSLPCLLSFAGGALDLFFEDYGRVSRSITQGLEAYERDLPTTVGPVRLTYFHNLSWDGDSMTDVEKPMPDRDFGSYDAYRRFLDDSMERLADNARASERRRPFDLITTLSSGYDSPTCSVLARQVGCREAFGFDRSRDGADDSGAAVAKALGLRYHSIKTRAWRKHRMAAVPFLAALTSNGSSVPFKSAEHLLRGRVVLTGFHGDKVWDPRTHALGPDVVRGDASGTDLTEYRLWAGFIDCVVPFWGVRQIDEINAIANSPELHPWNVKGWYNRPICRRIVEEAGVPRKAFGMDKKATAQFILEPGDFLTREMRLDYHRWVDQRRHEWAERGQSPPDRQRSFRLMAHARLTGAAHRLRASTAVRRLGPRADRALARLVRPADASAQRASHQFVFHWAVDRAKERYRDPRPGRDQPEATPSSVSA